MDARHTGPHVDEEKKSWEGKYEDVGVEMIFALNKAMKLNLPVTIPTVESLKKVFEFVADSNEYHHVDECEYQDEDRPNGPVPWEDLD